MIFTSSPFLSSVFTEAEQDGEALVLNLTQVHDLTSFDRAFLLAFEDALDRDDIFFRVEEDGVILAHLQLLDDQPVLRFTKVEDPSDYLGFNPRASIEEQVQSLAEAGRYQTHLRGKPYVRVTFTPAGGARRRTIWGLKIKEGSEFVQYRVYTKDGEMRDEIVFAKKGKDLVELPARMNLHYGEFELAESLREVAPSHVSQSRKTPGRTKSTYGGYRFVIGGNQRRTRDRAMNVDKVLKAKRASRRGLAKRIRAARAWHKGNEGKRWHKAQARYQQDHSSFVKDMANFLKERSDRRFHKGVGVCNSERPRVFAKVEEQPVHLRAFTTGKDLCLGEMTLFLFDPDNNLHLVEGRDILTLAEKEFFGVSFDPEEIGAPGYSLRRYRKEKGGVPWNIHHFFPRDVRKAAAAKAFKRIERANGDPELRRRLWKKVVYKGERRYKKEGLRFEEIVQEILDGVGPEKPGPDKRHDSQVRVTGGAVPVEVKNSRKTTFKVTELEASRGRGEVSDIVVHRHPNPDDPGKDQIDIYMVEPRAIRVDTPEKKGRQEQQRRIVANIKSLVPVGTVYEDFQRVERVLDELTVHDFFTAAAEHFGFESREEMPCGVVYADRETGEQVVSICEHLLTDNHLDILEEAVTENEEEEVRVFEDHYDPMRILRECALSDATVGAIVQPVGPRAWMVDETRIVFYAPKAKTIRVQPIDMMPPDDGPIEPDDFSVPEEPTKEAPKPKAEVPKDLDGEDQLRADDFVAKAHPFIRKLRHLPTEEVVQRVISKFGYPPMDLDGLRRLVVRTLGRRYESVMVRFAGVKEGAVKDFMHQIVMAVNTATGVSDEKLWREIMTGSNEFLDKYGKYLTKEQRKFLQTESVKAVKDSLEESCGCETTPASPEQKEAGKYKLWPHYVSHTHEAKVDENGNGESNQIENHAHRIADWKVEEVAGHTHDLGYRLDESKGVAYTLLPEVIEVKKKEGKQRLDESDDRSSVTQWTETGPGVFFPAGQVTKKLPPGYYSIESSMQGPYFRRKVAKTENLIRFPDSESDKVIDEINKFWTLEEHFAEHSVPYKRGMMLEGPPGSGKTCTIRIVVDDVVNKWDGIVVDFPDSSNLFVEGYSILRHIQPDVPLVVLMEDIDATLRYGESSILNLLDGMHDIHRVVFLATTNYPEKLGSRILNRPSRFDKRFHIGMPSAEARELYIRSKLNALDETTDEEIARWVEDTEGLSIAHIKELFVNTKILGNPYEEAVEVLKAMKVTKASTTFDDYRVEAKEMAARPISFDELIEAGETYEKEPEEKSLTECWICDEQARDQAEGRERSVIRLNVQMPSGAIGCLIGLMTEKQYKSMSRALMVLLEDGLDQHFDNLDDLAEFIHRVTGATMHETKNLLTEKYKVVSETYLSEPAARLVESTFSQDASSMEAVVTEGVVVTQKLGSRNTTYKLFGPAIQTLFALTRGRSADEVSAALRSKFSIDAEMISKASNMWIAVVNNDSVYDFENLFAGADITVESSEELEEAYGDPEKETLDDVLDNIIRKTIVLGSIDAIQDVDFADESHSVYLFLDATMTAEEVEQLREAINTIYSNTTVVASPDGTLPQGSEPAEWWVMFVPQEVPEGAMAAPYPPMWGGKEPVAAPQSYVPADAVADIAQGVDVDQAVDQLLKSESSESVEENVPRIVPGMKIELDDKIWEVVKVAGGYAYLKTPDVPKTQKISLMVLWNKLGDGHARRVEQAVREKAVEEGFDKVSIYSLGWGGRRKVKKHKCPICGGPLQARGRFHDYCPACDVAFYESVQEQTGRVEVLTFPSAKMAQKFVTALKKHIRTAKQSGDPAWADCSAQLVGTKVDVGNVPKFQWGVIYDLADYYHRVYDSVQKEEKPFIPMPASPTLQRMFMQQLADETSEAVNYSDMTISPAFTAMIEKMVDARLARSEIYASRLLSLVVGKALAMESPSDPASAVTDFLNKHGESILAFYQELVKERGNNIIFDIDVMQALQDSRYLKKWQTESTADDGSVTDFPITPPEFNLTQGDDAGPVTTVLLTGQVTDELLDRILTNLADTLNAPLAPGANGVYESPAEAQEGKVTLWLDTVGPEDMLTVQIREFADGFVDKITSTLARTTVGSTFQVANIVTME